MYRRCRAGTALLLVGLLLSTAATGAQEATPPAVRVVEQRIVAIEDGIPLGLSPDGRWLAVERRDREELCAYDTATLAPAACAPLPARSIRTDSLAWSPDGARLAFTEDLLIRMDESDLWVFDLAAESVTNLTDDGFAESLLNLPQGTPIDLAPAWSPDGAELVFARSLKTAEDVESTALYRIAAAGGTPRKIVDVADDRLAVYAGIRWLADGETILYSVDLLDADPAEGLWAVAADGGNPRQLVSAAEHDLIGAVLVDAAGGQGLLVSPGPRSVFFHVVDLATGRLTPVEQSEAAERPPIAAALSPDGTLLLLAHGTGRLVVRVVRGDGEQVLVDLDPPVASQGFQGGLTWATNDLVFGDGPGNTGVLLQIGQAENPLEG